MDLFEKCYKDTRAEEAIAKGYYPYFKAIQSGAGSTVMIDGREFIMIGSNNYLGLTQDPRIKEAAIDALDTFGSGCTGSRFLNGTLTLHEELEEKLADFVHKEACLVFSTGFQVNQGTISSVVGKDDLIFGDRGNHASIVDGCRLAFGKTYKYKHNDMEDLERLLQTHNNNSCGKLIVSDGVFSMEGDIVDLPKITKLAKKYNTRLMIDDAHSCGVLGKHGRGTGEHFDLENDIDLMMGTFSKSFASLGGFIAGEKKVVEYIKHHARSLIFSASMPPSAVATVNTALDILKAEPERLDNLWKNTAKMKKAFDEMGFNTGDTQTPIIPIIIGEDMHTFGFWKLLFEQGIFTNPVISPAVEPGHALLRTSYMATHTDDELDRVLAIFNRLGKKFGLIN
ncbi:aminotransferase class I/II-fold pyridoxal phosphate-dependent enzyme [candidate division KSB1 bacterium]|nr:aminotransferase class I/II-fold pyridoxal phosphate-dependent enzyme [candidate division KSB1 bacterium]MBL7093387.1 aminotransferase class I/II-fold pyridoxal phosphate-dependent enzyme [candidate division KSB1 bacterium]